MEEGSDPSGGTACAKAMWGEDGGVGCVDREAAQWRLGQTLVSIPRVVGSRGKV